MAFRADLATLFHVLHHNPQVVTRSFASEYDNIAGRTTLANCACVVRGMNRLSDR